jgi:hypothetical protein
MAEHSVNEDPEMQQTGLTSAANFVSCLFYVLPCSPLSLTPRL